MFETAHLAFAHAENGCTSMTSISELASVLIVENGTTCSGRN